MEYLRWILLGVAVLVVIAVYVWSRLKKQHSRRHSPLDAANDAPSAGERNGWMDGVGPVRVARDDNDIDEVLASMKEDARPSSKWSRLKREAVLRNVAKSESRQAAVDSADADEPTAKPGKSVNKKEDDLVALYLVAQRGEQIRGEQVLSATFAVQLEYGDKKIFHRKNAQGEVIFSMASMQEPGYFDIDNMHHLKTRGITLFMQLSFCKDPVKAVDEMLICAHSLASMLSVQVCNADRKLLDEAYTLSLRARAKQFSEK